MLKIQSIKKNQTRLSQRKTLKTSAVLKKYEQMSSKAYKKKMSYSPSGVALAALKI
jgi:hypothetical protein